MAGLVRVGAGVAGAGAAAVLVGAVGGVDVVLGACTAGSDFSPQPIAAPARASAAAHVATVRDGARRRPAFEKGLTARDGNEAGPAR